MRQAPAIIAQLQQIDGNMTKYNESITQGYDVMEDYEKAMQSWSNQFELAKNNVFGLNEIFSEFMQNIGIHGLKGFNGLSSGFATLRKEIKLLDIGLGAVTDGVLSLVAAFTVLNAVAGMKAVYNSVAIANGMSQAALATTAFGKATTFLLTKINWLALAIGAIAVGISIFTRMARETQLAKEKQEEFTKSIQKLNEELNLQSKALATSVGIFMQLSSQDLSGEWQKGFDVLSATIDGVADLVELLQESSKIETFKIDNLRTAEEILKNITKELQDQAKIEAQKAVKEDPKYMQYQKKLKELDEQIAKTTESTKTKIEEAEKYLIKLKTEYNQNEVADKVKLQEEYIKRLKGDEESLFIRKKEIESKFFDYKMENQEKYKSTVLNDLKNTTPLIKQGFDVKYKNKPEYVNKTVEKYGNKSLFDVAMTIQTKDIEKYLSVVKMSNEEQQAFLQLIKERQKSETEAFNSASVEIQGYIDSLEKIRGITNSFKKSIFDKALQGKNLETFSELKDIAKGLNFGGIDEGKKAIQNVINSSEILKTTLNGLGLTAETVIDKFTKDNVFLELSARMEASAQAVTKLNTALKAVATQEKKFKGKTYGDIIDTNDIQQQQEFVKIFNSLDPEIQVDSWEDLKGKAIDFKNIQKMIETVIKGINDANVMAIKVYAEKNDKQKEEKEVALDIFHIYDKTRLLQLEEQKAKQLGITALLTERDILEEQAKLSKQKYENDLADAKLVLGKKSSVNIDDTTSLNNRKIEIEFLIGSEKGEEAEKLKEEYKAIEEYLKLIQARNEEISKEKISQLGNTKSLTDAQKELNQYLSDQLKGINSVKTDEQEIITVRKEMAEYSKQEIKNQNFIEYVQRKQSSLEQKTKEYLEEKDEAKKEELKDLINSLQLTEEEKKKLEEIIKLKNKNTANKEKDLEDTKLKNEYDREITKEINKRGKEENKLQDLYEKEQELKDKLEKTDKNISDYSKIELDIEKNKTEIIKEQLKIQIESHNKLVDSSKTLLGLVDKLTGLDLSSVFNPISDLFSKNENGLNMFGQFEKGLQDIQSGKNLVSYGQYGNDIAKIAQGSALQASGTSAAVTAGAGIAGAVISTGMSIYSMMEEARNKESQKEEERYQKAIELAQKQVEAIESMRDALLDYQNKLIDNLSKMPTFENMKANFPIQDAIFKALKDGSKFISDTVTVKYNMKSEGKLFGLDVNWLDKKETKTKTFSLLDLFGFDKDINDMSLNELENAITYFDNLQVALDEINKTGKDISKDDDLAKLLSGVDLGSNILYSIFGADFELKDIESNISEVTDSIREYVKTWKDMLATVEDIMKTATFKSFKGVINSYNKFKNMYKNI